MNMDAFNRILSKMFDLVCFPFASFDPLWALIAISVLTGLLMLIIFRFTSNQQGIRETKNRIKAHFLEIRLYRDDLKIMLAAQKNILRDNLTYMKYSLKPMLFLMIPVILIMIQLSVRFDRYPLGTGESAILKLKFKDLASFSEVVDLKAPAGVEVETPALRIPAEKEIDWRIKGLKKGTHLMDIRLKDSRITKKVTVDDNFRTVSRRRVSEGFFKRLLYPGEESLPADLGIEYLEIQYPSIPYRIWGLNVHWMVIFFVGSIGAGLLLKKVFRVEI